MIVVTLSLLAFLPLFGRASSKSSTTTSSSFETTTTVASVVPTTRPSSILELNQAVSSLLSTRQGTVEAAVQNVTTGTIWSFGLERPQDEASVVKVNILTALLASSSAASTPLTSSERSLAQEMIEESSNDAATSLWSLVGSHDGIATFDRNLGLTATTPSPCVVCSGFPWPGWGLTTTTPIDQLLLLRSTFFDRSLLTSADRAFELNLMESVIPSERWGASSGVASNATVALKNGWLPLNDAGTDWQINSIGWVRGDGRDYLIALFSTDNPSEDYGIQTLDDVSKQVWKRFG
jgi:hypothetical protein